MGISSIILSKITKYMGYTTKPTALTTIFIKIDEREVLLLCNKNEIKFFIFI